MRSDLFAAMLPTLFAQDGEMPRWHPTSMGEAILSTLIFALIGVVVSVIAFKIWDRITPGNLENEICGKQNIAAAILGGSVVLGICIIIAAAMIG